MINLNTEERKKFATYLLQEALSSRQMADQMKKLPGAGMETMAKRWNVEAMAMTMIANKLIDTETMTVGEDDSDAKN